MTTELGSHPRPQLGLYQIVVDCLDPKALVRFWARLLGGEPVDRARGWSHVDLPGGVRLAFQPVPEEKAGKNRLHLDVRADDIGSAIAAALALGAVRTGGTVTDDQGSFQTMRDPEGNEFCVVTA
ncbi:VOC family protein [Streptomyces sp. NPDC098789]|uniref:VOC family protein n=1 Tax=Streptomyces sp. NPDC098789 TaxID=3366098 RepID=UPI0037FDED81